MIRWSGPEIMSESDANNYGVPAGSLIVWAGEADDAGHVEETEARVLEAHDGYRNEHGITLFGPVTAAWLETAVPEMLEALQ